MSVVKSTRCFRWPFLVRHPHPKSNRAMRLAFQISHCRPLLSPISIHNNPTGLSFGDLIGQSWEPHARSTVQGDDALENSLLHAKNEALRHVGSTQISFKGTSVIIWRYSSRRNRSYASPVRRPSKMKESIIWSSRTAHHTVAQEQSWKLPSTVGWWFSTGHTWQVYQWYRHDLIKLRQ